MMKRILLATILCAGASASSASAWQQTQADKPAGKTRSERTHIVDTREEGTTRLVIRDTDTGVDLEMHVRGVVFNDDYSDVVEIAPGGVFELRETRAGETRRLEVERDGSGSLRYKYRVGGDDREFDADGRAWLARVLRERVEGGFDAEARVARLYKAGGSRAVIEAARSLKSGYARAAYLRRLAKLDGPRDETAVEIVRSAARDKFSDYERAGVLVSIARRPPKGAQA
ncbi:MAG TPA: hypothetical protein VFX96_03455, partial [Pyrinomonadaceae bacterium]|nr:hypothetical protein [Pyrinomonadaceae bacterium]